MRPEVDTHTIRAIDEALGTILGPRTMVQVVCITIDGRKTLYLGPVVEGGEVQEIEFGEVIPAELAARLLTGEFSEGMGRQ